MLIGYARGAPHDQTLSLQKDVLQKAGCNNIFTDIAGGGKTKRTGLDKALSSLRPGDTLVVWKLGRLGTSIKDLIRIMTYLSEQEIGFQSLTDTINTRASGGTQVYKTFAALRDMLKAKTTAGLHIARTKGRKGGRPKLLKAQELAELLELYNKTDIPIPEIRRKFNLARSTFYRYVKPTDKKQPGLKGLVHRLREIGK
jgi:DNA invertase Pin-like site-specific DNA recombinase